MWIALLFPALPLDVFARSLDPHAKSQPFAVTTGGHYPHVVAVNAAAHNAGVKRGQLVSAALALAPGIALRERDAGAEHAALGDLCAFMLGFTPHASLAPPNAVLADLSASLTLFGGLARLCTLIGEGVTARGYRLRIGVAPTPVAALALARARQAAPVFARDQLASALARMPLAHFDIDTHARAMLAAAGVTTFGDVRALPRDALARRCGPALVTLIDRALGDAPDARAPYVPAPRFEGRLALPVPVQDVEALGFAVNRLVHDLAAWLLARGLGVTRIALALGHERHTHRRTGVPATEAVFALAAPTRTVPHLNGVLRERLARIALPAPVETLALCCADTATLAGHNLDLLPGNDLDAVVVPLIDRLRARLGEAGVMRIGERAEHRPEAALVESTAMAAARVPAVSRGRLREGPRLRHGTQLMPDADALSAQMSHAAPTAARPLWLLSEPAPLSPAFERAPWVLREGPERIESGWWDGNDVRRDYFIAQTPEDGSTWIYRDHRGGTDDGEWFLHGLFA
jgi:protein ImuB